MINTPYFAHADTVLETVDAISALALRLADLVGIDETQTTLVEIANDVAGVNAGGAQ